MLPCIFTSALKVGDVVSTVLQPYFIPEEEPIINCIGGYIDPVAILEVMIR